VAVVMDGNARWARARGLPPAAGHEAGRRALEETVRLSRAWGVRALTAFAFSHENWSRPKARLLFLARPRGDAPMASFASDEPDGSLPCCNSQVEVDFLMGLFERVIRERVSEFLRYAFAPSVNSLTLRSLLTTGRYSR
jgi:ditrans,polycis-polyprenyl diphosphate synthase